MQKEKIYYAVRQCDMNGDKYKWSNATHALASDTPESTYGSLSPIEAAKIWKKHSPLVVTFCFKLCDNKPLLGGDNIYYFEQGGLGWCALLNKSYNELQSGGVNLIPLSKDVLAKIKQELSLSTTALSSVANAALSAKDIAGNTIATAARGVATAALSAKDIAGNTIATAARGVGTAALSAKNIAGNTIATAARGVGTAALSAKNIAGNTIATAARGVGTAATTAATTVGTAATTVGTAATTAAKGVGSAVSTMILRSNNRVNPTNSSGGGSPHPYDFTTLARNSGNKNNYYVYA